MNFGKFFSWAMVGLSLLASVGYFVAGDKRMALYWFFAASLTATVTY
jgi:hypothetical protein